MLEVYSVGDLTRYLKELIEADDGLQDLWVQGEVSNFVVSTAGHAYFTLKDATSQVRCVVFRGQIRARTYLPANGAAVVVHGRISIYEPQGTYQLYADLIQPEGVGLLYLQFEELRARLEREGLFDAARKRPLPRFPRRIGVVTSPKGAVFRDIVNVIGRRFPLAELVLAPTLVQGEGAAESICQALQAIDEFGDVDLVILARGGGSLEDLWPFNEERVARAIFASRVPVISGVGHETDFTIADWVADLRAPTPSAAAELAVPDWRECLADVEAQRGRLVQAAQSILAERRREVAEASAALAGLSPARTLERYRQAVDDLLAAGARSVRHRLALERERLRSRRLQLQALSPADVLARGYSLCTHLGTGRVIKRVGEVAAGDLFAVRVADGEFRGKAEWWAEPPSP